MIKLNSISNSVFDAKDVENAKVKVNSTELSRRDIVSAGRLVVCEYFGNMYNSRPDATEKYTSRLASKGLEYNQVSQKFKEKKLLFCAAQVCNVLGTEAPATFEEFKKNSHDYASNDIFHKINAAIDRDVLTPLYYDVLNTVGMGLLQLETVPLGSTKELVVKSNDAFLFEDGAWGSSKSASRNYLYAQTITLTPKVFYTTASIKWYQDIVNGEAGAYYAAIMRGLYSKMYAKLMGVMKAAVGDVTASGYSSPYIPTGLTAPTYTTANWINITDKVAAANGVSVNDLIAIGSRSALNQVVPIDGVGGAILGFQYGLGAEWFRNGYLAKVAGVDLFPVTPAIVPGTQNSSLQTIDTGSDIYIMAKGGYKPIYGVVAEGSPIIMTVTPNAGDALGSADMTIDINIQAMFDFAPVFATKVGAIRSVYPSGV